MVLFGPREIMRSRQLKAIAERSDSDISGRSADETLRYRESSGAMSDTAPRPPDELIRSYAEYRARYFPEQVERERLAALTPEELGREWAERALDKFDGR